MEPSAGVLRRAAAFSGVPLPDQASERLGRYGQWLKEEAIPAGVLGRRESARLWNRHIGDSIAFARAWLDREPPALLVDLGSGAGLPGIPLAVVWPSTEVVLVERSARRCSLLRRAARILELENVRVRLEEVGGLGGRFPGVVARALAPPERMKPILDRLLAPGGTGVIGGSRVRHRDAEGFTVLEVPLEVLDHPAWLLIMRRP